MHKLLITLSLASCLLAAWPAAGQNIGDSSRAYTYTLTGNALRGFVLKHTFKMGHLSQGYTNGFEVGVTRNTYGAKPFEQVYNYPDIGLALSYFDYGSDNLGQSLGLIIFSDFYPVRTRFFEMFARIGMGMGYHTNPYHKEKNNKNVAMGSPVTFAMQTRLGVNLRIADRIRWNNYATITHFSFAAMKQPNMGVNVISYNTGLSYRLSAEKPAYRKGHDLQSYSRSIRSNIRFGYATKEIRVIGSPSMPVYTLSYYLDKQVSRTNIINAGFDFFANTALKEEMKHLDHVDIDDPPDYRRIGFSVGHELAFDKFGVFTQFGAYIYRPLKSDKAIYQRYGLKYAVSENWFGMLSFVSHYVNADHAEFSIGARF